MSMIAHFQIAQQANFNLEFEDVEDYNIASEQYLEVLSESFEGDFTDEQKENLSSMMEIFFNAGRSFQKENVDDLYSDEVVVKLKPHEASNLISWLLGQ